MQEKQQMRSVLLIMAVAVLLVATIVTLVALNSGRDEASNDAAAPATLTLQSADGPVTLEQFHGKLVLLFFGYTHCPDVCPTTMSHVADALDMLTPAELEQVQPLFITVDPARDSAEHLAKYVAFFHPKLTGLSGSPDAIAKVAKKFSVEFFIDKSSGADAESYLVNHTSYLFLLDRRGEVADMMSSFTTPADIAASIRKHISR